MNRWLQPLTLERHDYLFAQILIYVGALAFLIVAMRKLATVSLSEGEYFLGILLVLGATLLMIALGLIISVLGELKKRQPSA